MILRLSPDEQSELLAILNIALYDADLAIGQSHDVDEVAALRAHQAIIRRWIHRLSQEEKASKQA